jgi:aspartate oxidase
MSNECGVVRDLEGLRMATETLADLAGLTADLPARTIPTYEVLNVSRVSRAIVATAVARMESRGAHFRRDYPERSDDFLGRFVLRGQLVPAFVALRDAAMREPSK